MLLIVGVAYAQRLNLGSASGAPGTDVTIPITLDYEGKTPDISSISVDIGFDPNALDYVSIEIGPVSEEAEKEAMANLVSSNLLRVAILGYNQNVIQSGTLANITFHIKSGASGQITLYNTPSASDPNGNLVTVTGGNGQITVGQVQYPTLDLRIDPLMGTPNAFHFTDNITDPNGAAHITADTIVTGTEAVDIYVKCTYPDGQSAWLYFDADRLLRFHDEPAAEWSNVTFDELTDYALVHGAWWFDNSKKDEWNLPIGTYTWEITVVKAGGSIDVPEDIVQTDSATLTLE